VIPLLEPEAAAELRDAAAWYERRRQGLGDEFVDEVKATIEQIGADPMRFARYEGRPLKKSVRRALVKRFPYVASFELEIDSIRILSVSHGNRRPGYWKSP
jgi:plasmid stabilization system protein ParE